MTTTKPSHILIPFSVPFPYFPCSYAHLRLQCRSQGKTGTGKTYENEYCFFIHFVPLDYAVDPYSPLAPGEELPKIELMKEFVDSTATRGLFANQAT